MNIFKSKRTPLSASPTPSPIEPTRSKAGKKSKLTFTKRSKKPSSKQGLSRTPSNASTSSSGSSWSCHGHQDSGTEHDGWLPQPDYLARRAAFEQSWPEGSSSSLDVLERFPADRFQKPTSSSEFPFEQASSAASSVYPGSSVNSSMYHLPSPVLSARQSRDRVCSPQSSIRFFPSTPQTSSPDAMSNVDLPTALNATPKPPSSSRTNQHSSLQLEVMDPNPFSCKPYPLPPSLHLSINATLGPNYTEEDSTDDLCPSTYATPSYPASSRARPFTRTSSFQSPPVGRSRADSTASSKSSVSKSSSSHPPAFPTRVRSCSAASSLHGRYEPPYPSPLACSTETFDPDETLQIEQSNVLGFTFPGSSAGECRTPERAVGVSRESEAEEGQLEGVWQDFMNDVVGLSLTDGALPPPPNKPLPLPPAPSSSLPLTPSTSKPSGLAYLTAVDSLNEQRTPQPNPSLPSPNQSIPTSSSGFSILSDQFLHFPNPPTRPIPRSPSPSPFKPRRLAYQRHPSSNLSSESSTSTPPPLGSSTSSSTRSSDPTTPSFPDALLMDGSDGGGLAIANDALGSEFWRSSVGAVRAPTWWVGQAPSGLADGEELECRSGSEKGVRRKVVINSSPNSSENLVAWGEAL